MSVNNPGLWLGEPFAMGTAEQFAAVRDFLHRIDYSEAALCAGADVESLSKMKIGGTREVGFLVPDTPQALAVLLFLDGAAIAWELVRDVFDAVDLETVQALGLLQDSPRDPAACAATVALYPVEGLYIVSDRNVPIHRAETGSTPADIVFSAITSQTGRFLKFMPRVACGDYLELCSGAGAAALVAARDFAERACAVDITERSTRFARFNAALNGIANVEALAGDLYTPIQGRSFDVITAHPPYIPSLEVDVVFRDGGEDGEQVTRRIIEGLSDHLRPGGLFFCDCFMTDRDGADLEDRLRAMLGEKEHEFDILIGQARVIPASGVVGNNVAGRRITPQQADAQLMRLKELGVTQFVSGVFLIRRRTTEGPIVTQRRILSENTDVGHLLASMELAATLQALRADPTRLLATFPRCSTHTEILSRSALREGQWTISASSLATSVPFAVEAEVPAWFGTLLSWCDGQVTARDLLARLQDATIVPDSFPPAKFGALLSQLADGGFIELLDAPDDPTAAR